MAHNVYHPRVIDSVITQRLESVGAIVLEGPKWCGKSTTGAHHSHSQIYLDNPVNREQYIFYAQTAPQIILDGKTPRLIDEWEIAPSLWDSIRFRLDHNPGKGQFILAGSAKPIDRSDIYHSGTGRFAWLRMHTMSLWESGDSTGTVSISKLFSEDEYNIAGKSRNNIERIAFLCCRGGWPAILDIKNEESALFPAQDYFDAVVNVDLRNIDNINRNEMRSRKLMQSYARFQGTQSSIAGIVADINGGDMHIISEQTVRSYLDVLNNLYVVEDMKAWNPNLKSRTAIRTANTRYFTDPSIATAALGIGPGDLLNDLKTFGLIFETMCVRDLRVYARPLRGEVYHYRDKNGLECDAVIHLHNGKYGLIEIKLGGESNIDTAAANLIKLSKIIDTERMQTPSFMMILTAAEEYAYRRPDGVLVVPLGALRD